MPVLHTHPFFVELPWNTRLGSHTVESNPNRPDRYLTEFAEEHQLASDSRWEVALAQFMCTRSWNNIPAGDDEFVACAITADHSSELVESFQSGRISRKLMAEHVGNKPGAKLVYFPQGNITSLHELSAYLHKCGITDDYFTIREEEISHHAVIERGHLAKAVANETNSRKYPLLLLSSGIARLLGFDYDKTTGTRLLNGRFVYKSERRVEFNDGLHSLYVYADIAEPIPVGYTKAPLLRTVPVPGGSQNIVQNFTPLHYLPVRGTTFHSIDIRISGPDGRTIPLASNSYVTCKLHFRRAKGELVY